MIVPTAISVRASSSSVAKRRLAVGARSHCHDSVPGTSEMLPKSCIQIFKSLRPFGFVGCDNQGAQFPDFVFSTKNRHTARIPCCTLAHHRAVFLARKCH